MKFKKSKFEKDKSQISNPSLGSILPRWTDHRPVKELFSWSVRYCLLKTANGKKDFYQKNLHFPEFWSQLAIDIATTKYFKKRFQQNSSFKNLSYKNLSHENSSHENSLIQLVERVTRVLKKEVRKQLNFNQEQVKLYVKELEYLVYSQTAAFNSPVWFNVGVYKRPQTSACFIQSIDDSLEGIYDLLKSEALVFKYGSGTGTNFSALRSEFEDLNSGGTSSGLLSFLNVFDQSAGAIKSGGLTRRAAKMVIVDVDHPEIEEFVCWKQREEKKAQILLRDGFSSDLGGEISAALKGQNGNNSVRITDAFMRAVKNDSTWALKSRLSKKVIKKIKAKELWKKIAEACHSSADPGLQFHDVINAWHTCKKSGTIKASNPCSEFMFLDDSACNLASLNLVKFFSMESASLQTRFLFEDFVQAVKILILAQETWVDISHYPTEKIKANSLNFRPLGIGFANLGALFLRLAIPYDSEEARIWASLISALMTGQAYLTSVELARVKGAFKEFNKNKESMLDVLNKHFKEVKKIKTSILMNSRLSSETSEIFLDLLEKTTEIWRQVTVLAPKYGVRNSQVSVIAPTGTIGLFMDCDTTGIEPEFSLIKFKKIISESSKDTTREVMMVNESFLVGLSRLGYAVEERESIRNDLLRTGELNQQVHAEHRTIFQTAMGKNCLTPYAHLLMMKAVQPFISGAISKTVNLPESATSEDISDIYWKAWELGLKSVSLYRDKSKFVQPLSTKEDSFSYSGPQCVDCGL